MCDSGVDETKVRVFKVYREGEGGKCWIARNLAEVEDAEFDGSDIGDRIIIELGQMTEHEIEKLPDFDGW
jgi:hypothetical protein